MLSIRPKAVNEVKGREKASDSINAYVFYFSNDYYVSLSRFFYDPYRISWDVAFVTPLNVHTAKGNRTPLTRVKV